MITTTEFITKVVSENLCIKDPRNPEYYDSGLTPRKNCLCNSCDKDNDKLALIAIYLSEKLDQNLSDDLRNFIKEL